MIYSMSMDIPHQIKQNKILLFALIHVRLYLAEPDDEWDDKLAAANTFDISCGGGGSSSSLSATTFYVSANSNVVCC